jgi:two-component system sensor histidine kinase SenX3
MWFRKVSDEITESPAPDLFLDLINELDQDVLLLSGGDTPIIASSGVENLNILRD